MSLKIACVAVAVYLPGVAMCADLSVGDLTVSYEENKLLSNQLEGYAAARITIKNRVETLLVKNTALVPGCEQVPAVSSILLEDDPVLVLCGSYGGPHETIQIYSYVQSDLNSAELSFGETFAELKKVGDEYYALAASYIPSSMAMSFQAYKLYKDKGVLAFYPVDDSEAASLYRERLDKHLAYGVKTPAALSTVVGLIGQSRLNKEEVCEYYSVLEKKISDASDDIKSAYESLNHHVCKGVK